MFLRDRMLLLLFSYMCQYHHCQLECHGVFEFPDIQSKQLFQSFQPVDKCVSVQIELSGSFRNIQIIFVEFLYGILRLFIQIVRKLRAEYFI